MIKVKKRKILLLPGDGIGPEVIEEVKKVIEKQMEIEIKDPGENFDIDSFTVMLVITFADQKLNVKLNMETLNFDKFKSLNDIADTIINNKKN